MEGLEHSSRRSRLRARPSPPPLERHDGTDARPHEEAAKARHSCTPEKIEAVCTARCSRCGSMRVQLRHGTGAEPQQLHLLPALSHVPYALLSRHSRPQFWAAEPVPSGGRPRLSTWCRGERSGEVSWVRVGEDVGYSGAERSSTAEWSSVVSIDVCVAKCLCGVRSSECPCRSDRTARADEILDRFATSDPNSRSIRPTAQHNHEGGGPRPLRRPSITGSMPRKWVPSTRIAIPSR